MVGADTLVLLSDVDGLYTADPLSDPDAVLVPEVREITPEIAAMAGEANPGDGTGGMVTKLMAARIAFAAGCRMVIAPGKPLNALAAIDAAIDKGEGASCTWFLPSSEPRTAHKRWIASALNPAGTITIDAGAAQALTKAMSEGALGYTVALGLPALRARIAQMYGEWYNVDLDPARVVFATDYPQEIRRRDKAREFVAGVRALGALGEAILSENTGLLIPERESATA